MSDQRTRTMTGRGGRYGYVLVGVALIVGELFIAHSANLAILTFALLLIYLPYVREFEPGGSNGK